MDYNTEHALYNGHKLFGCGMDRSTKKYVVDADTAPFVCRMFDEYAAERSMQSIADELNAEGLRTTRGAKFGVKTLNRILKNRAYIGEYRHGDVTVEDGMPVLVDEDTFERVQNKRLGRYTSSEDTAASACTLCKVFCVRAPRGKSNTTTPPGSARSSAIYTRRARTTSRIWCCSHCTTLSAARRASSP